MSLKIFLFPFRVTRWNTAAQWCMAWCPDAQDPSLGVASTPNCGGFFGENLHDDSKKELRFWGDEALGLGVFSLIFADITMNLPLNHQPSKMWRWEAKCCKFLSPVFPAMNHDLKWGARDSTNSIWPRWWHPFRSWSSAKRALPTNWTAFFFGEAVGREASEDETRLGGECCVCFVFFKLRWNNGYPCSFI